MSTDYQYCPRCAKPLAAAEHGGLERLACHDAACGFVLWDNPVPVVAAIVEHEGDIILARNRAWTQKFFALITGFLERNDPSPEEGIRREVKEELGLDVQTVNFVGHYAFPRMNQLIIAYHVTATGVVELSEELVEYRRIKPEKLRPWPAATGLALRDWMLSRGLTPGEFQPPA